MSTPRNDPSVGQTITITGETASGADKSLTLTVWRMHPDGRALCRSASGTLYGWNPAARTVTTAAGKRRTIIRHGVATSHS